MAGTSSAKTRFALLPGHDEFLAIAHRPFPPIRFRDAFGTEAGRPQTCNNLDPHLWVYDKTSGEMLAEMELPANATGAPMTYMAGGKQYIAFPVGGGPLVEELIAVAL